jgi:hypothetical protein
MGQSRCVYFLSVCSEILQNITTVRNMCERKYKSENTKAKTQKRKYKEKPNMVSESRCQSLGGADQSSSPLSIPAIVSKICGDSDDKGAALACFKNYKYSFLLLFSPLLVCTPLLIEKCSALFPMCLSLRRDQKRRPAVHVAFAGTGVDLIL